MPAFKSFIDLVKSRRSVRRYRPEPVSREAIMACIEAARLAPSAENVQPWRFLVVDDPEVKAGLSREAFAGIYRPTRFAAAAPVLILLLARPDLIANRIGAGIQGTQYYLLDLGIAGEHLVLQAAELGLGACWIGWFNAEAMRRFFNIPRKYRIVSLLALGYPESAPTKDKRRRSPADIVWFNQYGSDRIEE
jgi:nitroreductase